MTKEQGPLVVNEASAAALERAVRRIVAEIQDGLRHGFFEFALTCEITTQQRRRLTLKAGKTHQFVIPKEECLEAAIVSLDSYDGSETDA